MWIVVQPLKIGYAFARGKPIIGYRGDLRLPSGMEIISFGIAVSPPCCR
jgi:hypothetical protein